MTAESMVDGMVDGNAIAGLLMDIFGRDMTESSGCCGGCGSVDAFGRLAVYRGGMGDVIRCPHCDDVLMVLVERADAPRMYFAGLRWLQLRPA